MVFFERKPAGRRVLHTLPHRIPPRRPNLVGQGKEHIRDSFSQVFDQLWLLRCAIVPFARVLVDVLKLRMR